MQLHATRVIAIVICLVLGEQASAQRKESRDCGGSYGGFDTRLQVDLVGVLPDDAPPAVGFEVAAAGPVVATKTRLYAIASQSVVAVPLEQEITGIAVDADGRLLLQRSDGVALVRPSGLEPVASWKHLEGSVMNSGAPSFLEVVSANGMTRFGARMIVNDRVLPIVEVEGPVRAATWDKFGLVTIVGDTLMRWVQGTNVLERLAVDAGLREATGACGLSAQRALVTLRNAALLFSGKSMTVIAAVGGVCRVSGADVFLFDAKLKRVWKVRDIDTLGDPERDRAHARRLLQLAVTQDVKFTRTREFSEAVRLVGCTAAHETATELQK